MKRMFVIIALVVLVVAAIGVKILFFPSVKDAWFAMDRDRLLKDPPGMVVFRPTHFHDNTERYVVSARYKQNDKAARWVMGRDLPLRIAIAVAYNVNRATVVLPPDAPTGHFDFLVTTLDDPPARLQAAIRHKLGLVAQKETRQTTVMAIRIVDPNLPNLEISDPTENEGATYSKGQLHFKHLHIDDLTDEFERVINVPVVDQTGLTNAYDFSVPWDRQTEVRFMLEATARATIDKMLNKIGLALQSVNAPVEVLVVTHS